ARAGGGALPGGLASVDPKHHVPDRVQLVLAAVVVVLVLTVDLRGVIGFSSFGVLLYYAVANAAAYTQDPEHRRWPKPVQVLGLIGCLVLVATLPWTSGGAGPLFSAAGVVGRLVSTRFGGSQCPPGRPRHRSRSARAGSRPRRSRAASPAPPRSVRRWRRTGGRRPARSR